MSEPIDIREGLQIPAGELSFTTSRSGGPGGQHANKVESRVTLRFDVDASASLDDEQKRRIHDRLGNRIGKDGVLQVSCDSSRSQAANRAEATRRFAELLRRALRPRRRRRPTRPSRAAVERRLERKRQRAEKKRRRRKPRLPEE